MEIIQASFQASFDSRVERLSDVDLADLRTTGLVPGAKPGVSCALTLQIFRYFDTDGDGVVAADQACRMFALVSLQRLSAAFAMALTAATHSSPIQLGLDVNATQVLELGELYLNGSAGPASAEAEATAAAQRDAALRQGLALSAEELQRRNERLWEDEWKLLDTTRRGRVAMSELRLFLASCSSTLTQQDTTRFLETFGNPTDHEASEELVLTKAGFLKFRLEYTTKNRVVSESAVSSDEDDDDGDDDAMEPLRDLTARGKSPHESEVASSGAAVPKPSRQPGRGLSDDISSPGDRTLSAREDALVLDPDELLESDESDEEPTESGATAV
ncbi:hypothetical protein BBJ28_00023252 [Nothophytophthora sp. Chile5]|nr:hypothetical protein BBJ28_00023252 [Nothophytophthora sp. Chile5]